MTTQTAAIQIDEPEYQVSGRPIVVYQMGKVGSESLVKSLAALGLDDSVHHIHLLEPATVEATLAEVEKTGRVFPVQLKHSLVIREYLDSGREPRPAIISGVRDPIAQKISGIFQNIPLRYPELIDDSGKWDESRIFDHVFGTINNYDPASDWNSIWFDHQFNGGLGIDVYQYPFDQQLGYCQFRANDLDVLVLRLENADSWPGLVTEFLGLEKPLEIAKTNLAAHKHYREIYRNVVDGLSFAPEVLDRIYSTRFFRHFYGEEHRTRFIERWSEKR